MSAEVEGLLSKDYCADIKMDVLHILRQERGIALSDIVAAVKKIKSSRQTVALTGAGISTPSGIPDFRGRSGLWKMYDPSVYAHISTFRSDPRKVWEMTLPLMDIVRSSEPNSAHSTLASMERKGLLHGIITQNIDGLHKRAGSRNVIEYHGTIELAVCTLCGIKSEIAGDEIPLCGLCGAVMKPDFIMFGEPVPPAAYLEAKNLASFSDVFIVAGTSAVVQPAAELPFIAKDNRAYIIEMNMEVTGLTNYITDCYIKGPLEETLPRLLSALSGGNNL